MNFSLSDSLLSRQRCRQWIPLITQQLRLRHVHQVFCYNLPHLEAKDSYYFTLHLTTLSAPFYTSEKIESTNPRWPELDQRDLSNLSAKAVVLRIWRHSTSPEGSDAIISTWGINFSGLIYVGCKIAEIQPPFFTQNAVILYTRGGYFTSHKAINKGGVHTPPFLDNLSLAGTGADQKLCRYASVRVNVNDIRSSYNIAKLRQLHSLQVTIKNKLLDVQNIKDRIRNKLGESEENVETMNNVRPSTSSLSNNVRYAPQLLTMNSLNKMLELKPTKLQQKEMVKIRKELEIAQFKTKLLSSERDKKSATIRKLKKNLKELTDDIEEKNSNLMDSYYNLSKEAEKLKVLRRTVQRDYQLYLSLNSRLYNRRKELLHDLLFIYPIQQYDKKFTIHGIYLPDSDYLTDCSDIGVSVALGYVTHILSMCSNFLQVPLRYPLTHCGSRSSITDNVSSNFPERERDFPLFTKGKDRMQFTYAVYLLNKDIAQLRWTLCMHTPSLKMTLPNLFGLLQGAESREVVMSISTRLEDDSHDQSGHAASSSGALTSSELLKGQERKSAISRMFRISECGPGLSEILAIPEAFMNKQISSDSFKNFIALNRTCTENAIVIKEGRSEENICDNKSINDEPIEQGTDLLDPSCNLSEMSKNVSDEDVSEDLNTSNGQIPALPTLDDVIEKNQCCQPEGASAGDMSTSPPPGCGSLPKESPLTARTDALLHTKSFNLVKPKSNL